MTCNSGRDQSYVLRKCLIGSSVVAAKRFGQVWPEVPPEGYALTPRWDPTRYAPTAARWLSRVSVSADIAVPRWLEIAPTAVQRTRPTIASAALAGRPSPNW
jgi:hypothetical protein